MGLHRQARKRNKVEYFYLLNRCWIITPQRFLFCVADHILIKKSNDVFDMQSESMTTKNKVTLSRALPQTVKRRIAAGYAARVAFLDPSASLRMTASRFFARICHAERSEASHKRVQRTECRVQSTDEDIL